VLSGLPLGVRRVCPLAHDSEYLNRILFEYHKFPEANYKQNTLAKNFQVNVYKIPEYVKRIIAIGPCPCYNYPVLICAVKAERWTQMAVRYKKLWKILIDKDMKKKDLQAAAGVSWASITKLSKCENVSMNVLIKICKVLDCDIGDIMELIPDEESESK